MSVFDQDQGHQETTTESFVKKLVETRGEQWNDPEVIAKGKLEGDIHISNLERQIAEMREDLEGKTKLEEIVKALEDKAAAGGTANPLESSHTTEAESNTTSEADIESLVEKAIQQREATTAAKGNLAKVEAELEAKYGDKANEIVQAKAKEMGLTVERMGAIAQESPTAFMAMVGEAAPASFTAPRSSVNTDSFIGQGEVRDFGFYQKMRKENPRNYYTAKIQNEMMKDRLALGDKF